MRTLFLFVAAGKAGTFEACALLEGLKRHGAARVIFSEHLPQILEDAVRGEQDRLPDLILVNAGSDLTWEDAAHLKAISDQGVRVFPNANNLSYSISKQLQKEAFDALSLPTAEWEVSPTTEPIVDPRVLDRLGRPVVTKPAFGGSEGAGVASVSTYDDLVVQKQIANAHGYDLLMEAFVPHGGEDLRISIHDGVAELPMRRIAVEGLITNASLGAHCETIDDPAVVDIATPLAIAAAASVGKLDWAGVDLMPNGRGGYVVCEVNGAPGSKYQTAARERYARKLVGAGEVVEIGWGSISDKVIRAAVKVFREVQTQG